MVTVILIVLMVSVSLLALRWISQFEEGECFDRLYEETGKLARSIERNTVSDAEKARGYGRFSRRGRGSVRS